MTMKEQGMEDQLKQIMADIFRCNVADIGSGFSMKSTDQWDSLKHMELIVSLESNFPIEPFMIDEIVEMTEYEKILVTLQARLK